MDHFKHARHVEAMNEYNKALDIDTNNVEALVARGALLVDSYTTYFDLILHNSAFLSLHKWPVFNMMYCLLIPAINKAYYFYFSETKVALA